MHSVEEAWFFFPKEVMDPRNIPCCHWKMVEKGQVLEPGRSSGFKFLNYLQIS
jgi:hypothetical protein